MLSMWSLVGFRYCCNNVSVWLRMVSKQTLGAGIVHVWIGNAVFNAIYIYISEWDAIIMWSSFK